MADQADKLRRLRLVQGRAVEAEGVPTRFGSRPAARSYAVVSGKGGVGKSSFTANLALALTRRGKRVLVVDGDLSLANVDLLLGLVPRWNLGDVVLGEVPIQDVCINTPDGIRVLPAASGVEELAELDDFRRERLLRQLSLLEEGTDLILIDCGSGIGKQTLHWARAADRALILTTPEPTAFSDAYAMVKVLSRTRLRQAPALIVNMTGTSREGKETARRIRAVAERFLGIRPDYLGAIPHDDAMSRAVRSQEPLLRMFPHSPAAAALERIAGVLMAEPDPPAPIEIEPEQEGYFLKVANGEA